MQRVAPLEAAFHGRRRSMGASVAALLAGVLLAVACIAVLSQAPSRQRSIELESEQAILAGAERAGFKAGEREEAKRQLQLQSLSREGHLGQEFQGLVDTTGKGQDFGSGVVSGQMMNSLIGCQKYKTPEFIRTCYKNKMGHFSTFVSPKEMLSNWDWTAGESLDEPVTPSTNVSPQMAVASAGSAVSNAARYHADGTSKDADEWSACFDEASGAGPCTPYSRSRASFPPFAVKGQHPDQPYQRVKQMSPSQAISNAVSGGWGDSNAWARMAQEDEAAAAAAAAGQGQPGAGEPTGSGPATPPEETPTSPEETPVAAEPK